MLASGRTSIAICDRCCFKYDYQVLRADGNTPGLRVCPECWDPKDPWRLPPLQPDAIALRYPRPDTPLVIDNIIVLPFADYVTEMGDFYVTESGVDNYITNI